MKKFILLALLMLAGLMTGCASTQPPAAAAITAPAPVAPPIVAPAPAGDDMVASNGRDSVRLTQQPCPPAILVTIPPELQGKVKAASAVINNRQFAACWIASGGYVILQYEDGDSGMLPQTEFHRSPSI